MARPISTSIRAAVIVGMITAIQAQEPAAFIVNSGSTNRAGFRIMVQKSGDAEFSAVPRGPKSAAEQPIRRKLSESLSRRLYSDIAKAKPLAGLPHQNCLKSVSFGTRLTIEYSGETTPDLSCPQDQDSRVKALRQDADEILKLFPAN